MRVDPTLLDDEAAEEDLLAAAAFWESRAKKPLFHFAGSVPSGTVPYTGPAANPDDLLENAIFFQTPWPFDGKIAGKIILHTDGSQISKALIFLSTETPLCAGLCVDELDKTSRRKLITHELGHFLGFAHTLNTKNVMYPEIQPGGSLEELEVDEPLLLKLIQ